MLRAALFFLTTVLPLCASYAADAPSPAASPKASGRPVFLDLSQIPQRPTAPPVLSVRTPPDLFLCSRVFVFGGRALPCDSQLQADGEILRPIMAEVPISIDELNIYQSNRQRVKGLAYVGSTGFLIAALGYFISKGYEGNARIAVRNIGILGGLAIASGSFIYGFTTLQTNEEHLGKAVKAYNQARPDRPIELQFSTGISF